VNEPDGARRSPKPEETGAGRAPFPSRSSIPKRADSFALAALLFAGLCVAAAYGTTRLVGRVVQARTTPRIVEAVFLLAIAGTRACSAGNRAATFARRAGGRSIQ
jgi:hypothetical protein